MTGEILEDKFDFYVANNLTLYTATKNEAHYTISWDGYSAGSDYDLQTVFEYLSEGVWIKSTAPERDPRKLTTAQKLATQFWYLSDTEMGEFFEHLLEISGEHDLLSQMLWCRQACEEGNQKGLEGFQVVASAAYRYILGDHLK